MNDRTVAQTSEPIGSIGNRCRIIESVLENHWEAASDFGFTIENSRLYPESTSRRLQWRHTVQEVFTSKAPQYVVVRDKPELECALLAVNPNSDVVQVSVPKSQICRAETARRVGELMGFTKREREVVLLLAQGCDTKEIAHALGTKISTVRSQIKSVMLKSGISGVKKFLVFLSCLPEPPDYDGSNPRINIADSNC